MLIPYKTHFSLHLMLLKNIKHTYYLHILRLHLNITSDNSQIN